jgi:hypothetical protein
LYSAIVSRFLIGLMAKRPSPVNERPTRNDLRGISDWTVTSGSMRMADETPRVNQVGLLFPGAIEAVAP